MAKKAPKNQPDSFEGIEMALTRTERFIEDNSKVLSYIMFGIIIVVMIIIGTKRFYLSPLEEEAAGQMFMAEKFFDKDSFNLALNGYGTYPGFLEVNEDYGLTKTGKLAKYYSGICYLKLGDYESAVDYLSDFRTEDVLVGATQYSALGDAYVELGEYEKAVKSYKKATAEYTNEFTSPIILKKTAIVYEEMDELVKANETYKKIKSDFPESEEARDIEKYIARTK